MKDDVISRQAAIKDAESWVAVDEYEKHLQKGVIEWLKEFPSAQPEQRWISSGKKPLKEGSYLVWMPFAPPKHRMAVAEYCGGYWNIKTPISAWMQLPESYNAERRTDGEETDRKTNHFKTVDIYLQS